MKLPIPVAALTQHTVALGKTRSGKSSKLRLCAEYLLDHGEALGIIDVKGDWWGIKSSADGKGSGYPLVIFGGEHADVPINEHSGAHVAELVATGNRPYLIDLGGWMIGERTRFFIAFASTLFRFTKGKRYLVMPECHNFAPKGKIFDPEAGKCLHWANRLASEGQGKGLILLADSQRPQKVHNDFLTSCETLIACRVVHKADRDAIKDWIDGCADPATGKQLLGELAQMQRTDAWVWSPEISFGPERITWPMFRTYDSFKPQAANAGKLKGWAEVDLDDVKAKLGKVVEEAKANDPKALKARIAELERKLKVSEGSPSTALIPRETYEADKQESRVSGEKAGRVYGWKEASTQYFGYRGIIEAAIESAAKTLVDNLRQVTREAYDETTEKLLGRVITINAKPAAADSNARSIRSPTTPRRAPAAGNGTGDVGGGGFSTSKLLTAKQAFGPGLTLPPGERATLGACIQYPDGLERSQLTIITGYKRSSRDAYIQRLSAKGYVSIAGDRIVATDEGIAALPDFEPLPRGEDLINFWRNKLPEGERRVLDFLIEQNGQPVERAAIDSATGYQRSSRDAYLQRLRAKQLVVDEGRGQVKASAELFA